MFPKRTSKNKYGNTKVTIEDIMFDSKKEGMRYLFLKSLVEQGIIKGLQRQVRYELIPKITHEEIVHLKTKTKTKTIVDQLPTYYFSDFEYTIVGTGEHVVEDVKPSPKMLPADFRLKAKLFFWRFGEKITLVFKHNQPIN